MGLEDFHLLFAKKSKIYNMTQFFKNNDSKQSVFMFFIIISTWKEVIKDIHHANIENVNS